MSVPLIGTFTLNQLGYVEVEKNNAKQKKAD